MPYAIDCDCKETDNMFREREASVEVVAKVVLRDGNPKVCDTDRSNQGDDCKSCYLAETFGHHRLSPNVKEGSCEQGGNWCWGEPIRC